MPSTQLSRRDIYRSIAQHDYSKWPAYSSTPLYDRSSLDGLPEDIRTVAAEWFDHEAHDSVEAFAVHYPFNYVDFGPHDRCSSSTQFEMSELFRSFLLKALHDGTTKQLSSNTYSNVRRLVSGLTSRRSLTSQPCGEHGINALRPISKKLSNRLHGRFS